MLRQHAHATAEPVPDATDAKALAADAADAEADPGPHAGTTTAARLAASSRMVVCNPPLTPTRRALVRFDLQNPTCPNGVYSPKTDTCCSGGADVNVHAETCSSWYTNKPQSCDPDSGYFCCCDQSLMATNKGCQTACAATAGCANRTATPFKDSGCYEPTSACPEWTITWPGEPCQSNEDATAAATAFLSANLAPWDELNRATLFDGGIAVPTANLSLMARTRSAWAASVPRALFDEYVLPFASVNEPRTDWRQLFFGAVLPLVANATSLEAAATAVNAQVWAALGKPGQPIRFKSEQTPLIFDAFSTMAFGYASCTGISILYVNALRAVGIPARLVGTPAWNGNATNGNHNWVEAWLGEEEGEEGKGKGGGWHFVEGAPAGGGESFGNPCDKWFCSPAKANGTSYYAAAFARGGATAVYPMAWDPANLGVPGVDRTDYYRAVCGAC